MKTILVSKLIKMLILTLRGGVSEFLESAVGELVNGVPPHLMDCSSHIESHYVLGPALLSSCNIILAHNSSDQDQTYPD